MSCTYHVCLLNEIAFQSNLCYATSKWFFSKFWSFWQKSGYRGLLFLLLELTFCALYWREENKLFLFQSCNHSNTDRCPQVLEQAPKQLGVVGHLIHLFFSWLDSILETEVAGLIAHKKILKSPVRSSLALPWLYSEGQRRKQFKLII